MTWLDWTCSALLLFLAWDAGRWLVVHGYSGTDLDPAQLWLLGLRCVVLLVAAATIAATGWLLARR